MSGVTLVKYGLGNIQAFINIYHRLNIPVFIAENSEQLKKADKIILPGVGAFDWAMEKLNKSGMRDTLDKMVLVGKVPILGVCVGMQMMGQRSEEGALPGLSWIDADVINLRHNFFNNQHVNGHPLPHMGWNDVLPVTKDTIFKDITDPRYYFLHSYIMTPKNSADILTYSRYGGEFASAICKENVYGTQFHPEKSHAWGIDLLRNFAEL
nr:imidazole glycerol phosphate synthase subunit HisH [Cytophagales bacterium]